MFYHPKDLLLARIWLITQYILHSLNLHYLILVHYLSLPNNIHIMPYLIVKMLPIYSMLFHYIILMYQHHQQSFVLMVDKENYMEQDM